jgi:hypothetical protein
LLEVLVYGTRAILLYASVDQSHLMSPNGTNEGEQNDVEELLIGTQRRLNNRV